MSQSSLHEFSYYSRDPKWLRDLADFERIDLADCDEYAYDILCQTFDQPEEPIASAEFLSRVRDARTRIQRYAHGYGAEYDMDLPRRAINAHLEDFQDTHQVRNIDLEMWIGEQKIKIYQKHHQSHRMRQALARSGIDQTAIDVVG